MEQKKCCLISDYDGVLVDSLPLIDEYVKEIDYKASDEYGRKLFERTDYLNKEKQRLEEERDIYGKEMQEINTELAELDRLRSKHYDHKDIILEEVNPEYRGLINYHEIYKIENAYPGVMELINKIWELNIYHQIIVNSNVNVESEIVAKKALLKEYLPMVKFVPVRFHLDPYYNPITGLSNKNRVPSNKLAVLIKTVRNIDVINSSVVDDTKGVIEKGIALGFNCYHRRIEDDVRDVFINACNDTIDSVHEQKIKKLSR